MASNPTRKGKSTNMAKEKEDTQKADAPKADPRQAKWEAHQKAYAIKNPVKYAAKKAAGHYDRIPDTFQ